MNTHVTTAGLTAASEKVAAPAEARAMPAAKRSVGLRIWRGALSSLTVARVFRGGRVGDRGRLPRYLMVAFLAVCGLWGPIVAYVTLAPVRYTSELALILPGAGAQSSVTVSDIGQASSAAASPYSSSAVSPTVTYKSLLMSRVLAERAAVALGVTAAEVGAPKVKLQDLTSLIKVSMKGSSPEDAHARASAMLDALLAELDTLRSDEIQRREQSTQLTIGQYKDAVESIQRQISALQAESGLISEQQYKDIVSVNERVRKELAEARAALTTVEHQAGSLVDLLGTGADMAASTLRLHTDAEFKSLAGAAAQESALFAAAASRFGKNHPARVNADLRFRGTRARMVSRGVTLTGMTPDAIDRQMDNLGDGERIALLSRLISLTAEESGLRAKLETLQGELDAGERRALALVDTASKLDSLQRDYKVAEAVFASALARTNTSRADVFASYPMVQVAEPPTMPWSPSSPNIIIAIAAGVAGTFMLIFGLILGWIRRPLIDKLTTLAGDANA
ncbi:hypothetical protein RDV64_22540 [Acuticoccus sp. MNP-M23]|uniref:GumC family protein n=1 Tax=Acuticoccus sp. MNP-M23 TaxID=3072793 RepID=UPI0028164576|nr:hypothetical protein [Acuticoccus sp. MNP-M23]WMS42797.1 hypothetical protein RDV64_22540 [Acuticoccus sp. MNP-M23]